MQQIIALLFLSFLSTAFAGVESDSGIDGPAYETIVSEMQSLEKQYPQIAKVIVYGRSVQGRPLTLIRIGGTKPMGPKFRTGTWNIPKKAVLITGATHGNEFLGVEHKLPDWFLNHPEKTPALNKYLSEGGVVYIAPVFNPDGYYADERENKNGEDLNRDFPLIPENEPGFTQPETLAIGNYLANDLNASNLRLNFTLDYHCCIGAFIHPWSYTEKPMQTVDYNRHQTVARSMQRFFGTSYKYGSTYDVLGYFGRGTSKDYYFAKYGATSFTFEGQYKVEKGNFEKHVAMWEALFDDLNNRPAGNPIKR